MRKRGRGREKGNETVRLESCVQNVIAHGAKLNENRSEKKSEKIIIYNKEKRARDRKKERKTMVFKTL